MKDLEASKGQIEHFDKLSHCYKHEHDRVLALAGGNSDHFYHAKIKLIKKWVKFSPRSILDFGCGTGRLTALLERSFPGALLSAVDPSPQSLEEAKSLGLKNTSFQTRLDGKKHQLGVAAGVFHHIPNALWLSNMKDVAQSLESNGRFFVFEHNPLSLATRFILALGGNDRDANLVYPWQMHNLFQRAGFHSVEVHFISFFPSFFTLMLPLEEKLSWCPLGAQYLVTGVRD